MRLRFAVLVVAFVVGAGGAAWAAGDVDADGIRDDLDNCPGLANVDQGDADDDGAGDACDGDGDLTDGDLDAVASGVDNCRAVANMDQLDTDGDGVGDVCDADIGPDGRVRRGNLALTPDDVYNTTAAGQSRAASVGNRGTATFTIQIRNDGPLADTIRVRGPGSTGRFTVTYKNGPTVVTGRVVDGTFQYANLARGGVRNLTVVITAKAATPANAAVTRRVVLTGQTQVSQQDAVKVSVTRH